MSTEVMASTDLFEELRGLVVEVDREGRVSFPVLHHLKHAIAIFHTGPFSTVHSKMFQPNKSYPT